MPKYIELSAHVNIGTSVSVNGENLGTKKLKPYLKNGEFQGYIITSPATGREILIEKDNEFNGDLEFPTFANSFSADADPKSGMPEEHLGILLGQVVYFRPIGNGEAEVLGSMPMIDCTWEPEEGGTGRCT